MNDKKHIDRLFQEKLKDFEATPSNAVWENISAELQTEIKERRIIPLWIKLSGIAALLLLMFTVGNRVFTTSDENTDQNTIVDTDNNSNAVDQNNLEDKENTVIDLDSKNLEQEKLASEETVESSTEPELLSNESDNKLITSQKNKESNVVVSNSSIKKSTNQLQKNNIVDEGSTDSSKEASVANNSNTSNSNRTNSNVTDKKGKETNSISINKDALDTALNKATKLENAVAKKDNDNKINETDLSNSEQTEDVSLEIPEKESIEDALAENTLQDDPEEEKKKRNKIENRWKVSPSIAPVYFNTLGSGSSIHEQFNENGKTGNVNMSYGVRGSYALNDKLSVRAGVNKVTLGYSTDDVFVLKNVTATPSDGQLRLRNVALTEEVETTSFISAEGFDFAQIPSVLAQQIVGSIDQKLGFIEIPLEIEYELSDQKLGLRVLGGFSALFLDENEVYSTLDGQTSLIGQATNINKTSFSANLGVGLDFKLSEKFKLNLEPTFKYQLNTFSNTSGDFKPYFIGIYSGFSFKF